MPESESAFSPLTSSQRHRLFPSLESLISPETIGAIEGAVVTDLRVEQFESTDSLSGSRFLSIESSSGHRYVVKRIAAEWDWLMRVSNDTRCRQAVAWQAGIVDSLPSSITAGVVAASLDGDGWAILLENLAGGLIPPGDDPITAEQHVAFIEAMAEWNAVHFESTAGAPEGLLGLTDRYSILTPRRCLPESEDQIPRAVVEGWKLLDIYVESDVARTIAGLLDDPGPLCAALSRFPQTIVHGDWKLGNLGLIVAPSRRVILLDWGQVGVAPPAVDLAWYLAVNSARMPESKEAAIDRYRSALADRLGSRFIDEWWRPSLALALLGAFLQLGWPKLLGAGSDNKEVRERERAELIWWSAQVRAGAALL